MPPPIKPLAERFAANTKQEGDCIVWNACRDRDGYGVMTIGRKQFRAHRAAYALANGSHLSEVVGLVCHSCDNRPCVNPAHLFLGTHRDNTRDMIAKGRNARMIDRDHPNTKISHAERETIRLRRRQGQTLKHIAADYDVSFQTISSICRGARSYGPA